MASRSEIATAAALPLLLGACLGQAGTPDAVSEPFVVVAWTDLNGALLGAELRPTAQARLVADDRRRLIVFPLPAEAFVDSAGQPIDLEVDAPEVTVAGQATRAGYGACGSCGLDPGVAPALVRPGDQCPPPAFSAPLVYEVEGGGLTPVELDPATLSKLRAGVRLSWPGDCACDDRLLENARDPFLCSLLPVGRPLSFDRLHLREDGVVFAAHTEGVMRVRVGGEPEIFHFSKQALSGAEVKSLHPRDGGRGLLVNAVVPSDDVVPSLYYQVSLESGAVQEVSSQFPLVEVERFDRLSDGRLVGLGAVPLQSGRRAPELLVCADDGGESCARVRSPACPSTQVQGAVIELFERPEGFLAVGSQGALWLWDGEARSMECLSQRPFELIDDRGDRQVPRWMHSAMLSGGRAFFCMANDERGGMLVSAPLPDRFTPLGEGAGPPTFPELELHRAGRTCSLSPTRAGGVRALFDDGVMELDAEGRVLTSRMWPVHAAGALFPEIDRPVRRLVERAGWWLAIGDDGSLFRRAPAAERFELIYGGAASRPAPPRVVARDATRGLILTTGPRPELLEVTVPEDADDCDGIELRSLPIDLASREEVLGAAMAEDGTLWVASSTGSTVTFENVDLDTGEVRRDRVTEPDRSSWRGVELRPEGVLLAAAPEGELRVISPRSGCDPDCVVEGTLSADLVGQPAPFPAFDRFSTVEGVSWLSGSGALARLWPSGPGRYRLDTVEPAELRVDDEWKALQRTAPPEIVGLHAWCANRVAMMANELVERFGADDEPRVVERLWELDPGACDGSGEVAVGFSVCALPQVSFIGVPEIRDLDGGPRHLVLLDAQGGVLGPGRIRRRTGMTSVDHLASGGRWSLVSGAYGRVGVVVHP